MEAPEAYVVDTDTSDAIEMGPKDAGEYKVQVLKAEFRQSGPDSNSNWKAILLTLDIPDETDAEIFSHMQFLPDSENQERKRFERSKGDLAKFKAAFGIGDSEPFTVDDLVGREAWAYLTIEQNEEYGDRNKVQRWITGPSSGDSAPAGTPSY